MSPCTFPAQASTLGSRMDMNSLLAESLRKLIQLDEIAKKPWYAPDLDFSLSWKYYFELHMHSSQSSSMACSHIPNILSAYCGNLSCFFDNVFGAITQIWELIILTSINGIHIFLKRISFLSTIIYKLSKDASLEKPYNDCELNHFLPKDFPPFPVGFVLSLRFLPLTSTASSGRVPSPFATADLSVGLAEKNGFGLAGGSSLFAIASYGMRMLIQKLSKFVPSKCLGNQKIVIMDLVDK